MNDCRRIVCLHGMWMPGAGMMYIKHRLETDYDFEVELFSYTPTTETLNDIASNLSRFISAGDEPAHLVGHSLGGVVALRLLAQGHSARVGRVVCIGSPLCGSRAAYRLNRLDWGNLILGKVAEEGIIGETAESWASEVARTCEIGVIAGDVPVGFGRFVAGFDEPNDGTIAVSETRMPGARDHLVMPVNHVGMLISKDVVDQTAAFLKRGEFLRET